MTTTTTRTTRKKIAEAVEYFGQEAVTTALLAVEISDPDCAYTLLQDSGLTDAAEAVEHLFFG